VVDSQEVGDVTGTTETMWVVMRAIPIDDIALDHCQVEGNCGGYGYLVNWGAGDFKGVTHVLLCYATEEEAKTAAQGKYAVYWARAVTPSVAASPEVTGHD
jgi:hypothetical protein